ncbi:adenosylcobinamide-GDP ribazoletransferase [Tessaracoccus sp. SD287]|uniref:adenosylcobinamide-GDP ribazoletransferase n=1 Tax=Tessaracoccus sp. SD287 TaxID=2782008 RepID=UPI001A96138C|nr:adenosylcobinamide-GDP ribazoletransferase [Tessaracoccus sp. SD287]MBO1029974.1 adenosylcobinamide-GDP ribazoletransferase [Tessaracoccus sp. SD287]
MSREPHPLHASMGLFTTIPVPPITDLTRRTATRAMAAFPVVGSLLGIAGAVVLVALTAIDQPWLGAVLAVAALAWLTGGLHLDGVADTADGLGSRRDPETALAIMKRSDIGPMGVITLLMVLLVDVTSLVGLTAASDPSGRGLWLGATAWVVATTTGRVVVVWATTTAGPVARPGGFGALFHQTSAPATALAHSVLVVLGSAAAGWWAAGVPGLVVLPVAVLVGHGLAHLWHRHLVRRLGGHTGDTFGSLVELTQSVVLVTAAIGMGIATQF